MSPADAKRVLEESADEYERMKAALVVFAPSEDVRAFIWDAYNDPRWDWRESDGCTAVSELYSPPGVRFWPCVGHDRYCAFAAREPTLKAALKIRRDGDRLFFRAQRQFGVGLLRAWWRYRAVRRWGKITLRRMFRHD